MGKAILIRRVAQLITLRGSSAAPLVKEGMSELGIRVNHIDTVIKNGRVVVKGGRLVEKLSLS